MKKVNKSRYFCRWIPGLFMLAVLGACSATGSQSGREDADSDLKEAELVQYTGELTEIAVEPPPLTDGIFPCNDCHSEIEPNPQRRELVDFHDDISAIFHHDSENRWCLDCHDMNKRDSLRRGGSGVIASNFGECGLWQCTQSKYSFFPFHSPVRFP